MPLVPLTRCLSPVRVYRNDEITVEQALALHPTNVVISPGPGTPAQAGVSKDIIAAFAGKVPVLGVCLGHQAIVELYGGEVVRCGHIMHGKVSPVLHDNKGVYAGLDSTTPPPPPADYPAGSTAPLTASLLATRYHSLVGTSLPRSLVVTSYVVEEDKAPAVTQDEQAAKGKVGGGGEVEEEKEVRMGRTVMGVRHERFTVEGVQFHPESVSTQHGMRMLENFLRLRGGEWQQATLV